MGLAMADSWNDNRTIIVGLGLSGLSCARHLHRRNQSFAVVDSRVSPPGLAELRHEMPDVPVILGHFPETLLGQAERLLLSPGVDPRHPAIRRALAAGAKPSGDIDIFSRQAQAPIIAVTGSNAKSTVVTLVGEMAKAAGSNCAVAGNIGKPVLELLEEAPRDLYVLELSSFQLETTERLGAAVATVLNMSPDHMDRYDSMQSYHNAKHRIFRACGHAVVNRDDLLSRPLLAADVPQSSFGLSMPDIGQFGVNERGGELYLAHGKELLLPASRMRMVGLHNVANALAALALGQAMGLDLAKMVPVLEHFGGLPHRCQWLADKQGVAYYNDSKGTNVGATIAAVKGLASRISGKLVLIAGGVGKGQDFSALRDPVMAHCRALVTLGEDGPRIAALLQGPLDIHAAASMEEAVSLASGLAQPGDAVLLSPACASFDMFRDYVHRGESFAACVGEVLA